MVNIEFTAESLYTPRHADTLTPVTEICNPHQATSFSLLIPFQGKAGTVVFTNARHPPKNLTTGTEVVWMNGSDLLQLA